MWGKTMEEQKSVSKQLVAMKHQSKFCTITDRQFRTKRRTYQISKVEKTEVRRNLLIFFPICLLALLFTYKFWAYLYTNEKIIILVASSIVGIISLSFGTLYVYSKALGEPALFGYIPSLMKIRTCLDDAMFSLEHTERREDYVAD